MRGLVAVAPIEPPEWMPEWMAASGASSEDIADWERHARAQLAADWRRRLSITLQRGNARIILGGAGDSSEVGHGRASVWTHEV